MACIISVAGQGHWDNRQWPSPRLYVRLTTDAKILEFPARWLIAWLLPKPYLKLRLPVLSDYRNLFIAENPTNIARGWAQQSPIATGNPVEISVFFNLSLPL